MSLRVRLLLHLPRGGPQTGACRALEWMLPSTLVSGPALSSQASVLWPCVAMPAELRLGTLSRCMPHCWPSLQYMCCQISLAWAVRRLALPACRTYLTLTATSSDCRWTVRQ